MALPVLVDFAAGQIWEFLVRGLTTDTNQQIINRLRYLISATDPMNPIATNAQTPTLTALAAMWRTNALPVLCSTYQVQIYQLQLISNVGPQPLHPTKPEVHYLSTVQIVAPSTDVGGLAGPPAPDFTTARLHFKPVVTARSTRSGMSLGPLAATQIDGNAFTPADLSNLRLAAAALIGAQNIAGYNATLTPGVFAATPAINVPNPPPYTSLSAYIFGYSTVLVNDWPGTQNTRKRRPAGV